jgi:hypothetical protein
LDYFLARYYSSTQGRFTSPDEPFADQDEEDPQSWNLYSYVINNPLKYDDPLGLWKRVKTDDGRVIYESDSDKDTLSSLAELLGTSADRVVNFFDGRDKVELGGAYDVTDLASQLDKEDEFDDLMEKATDKLFDRVHGFDFQLPQRRFDPNTPFTMHYPGIRFPTRTDNPLSPNIFAKGAHEQKKPGKLGQFKGTLSKRAENNVVRRIARKLGLDKSQQRRLHDEIQGTGMTREEIEEYARSIFDKLDK